MDRCRNLSVLPITVIGLACSNFLYVPAYAGSSDIAEKGTSVYCFMRGNGNSHEVSWEASYEIIKRQKSSIFKTSPKHAAVMIIETVVENPDKYQNCGSYLGHLLGSPDINTISEEIPQEEFLSVTDEMPTNIKKGDRYSY